MRKNLLSLLIASIFIGLFCGCVTPTDANAVRLAVTQSNNEALRLYHVAPFKAENGKLRMEGNHWVWDARTSAKEPDMVAKVTFDRNGAVATVDVRMQNPTSGVGPLK